MAFVSEQMKGGTSAGQAKAMNGFGGTLAAVGSTAADAALVTTSVSIITGANATTGVILPAVGPGETCTLFNNSASTLKVWPPTGAAITVVGTGLGTANAAFSQLTYKTVIFTCQSSTQWFANVSA